MSESASRQDYDYLLHQHLVDGQYEPETFAAFRRMCRVGRVSAETALEIVQVMEQDHRLADERLQAPLGAVATPQLVPIPEV